MSHVENGRELVEENPERPLEKWELRDFRRIRPDIRQLISDYKFTRQLFAFLWRLCIWSGAVFGTVYVGKDMIWRILKAIFQ